MKKIRLAIMFCVIITILVITISIKPFSYIRIEPLLDNAEQIEYIDITQQVWGYGSSLKSGEVEVKYCEGHISNYYTIVFKSFKPYESLKLYNVNGVLVVIYNEKESDVKSDIVIRPEYFPFIPIDMDKKVKVYKNNRLVLNVLKSHTVE